jgi:hypothetical protein
MAYYCTPEGQVKGELEINQHRILFRPELGCPENKAFIKEALARKLSTLQEWLFKPKDEAAEETEEMQMKKFVACIDIGDIVSCQLR